MTGNYQYTKSYRFLNDEQRRFYEHNGFLVVRNNVDHGLLNEMEKRFKDICNGETTDIIMTVMKDPSLKTTSVKGEFLINKLQDFLYDDILFKYAISPSVTKIIESIIGPSITAIHSMLINKPPNAKPEFSLHPLHQDLHYFPIRPANGIAATWTAMEHIDRENGCLHVIPGSHRKGELYPHVYPKGTTNAMYHGVYGYGFEDEPKTYLEMEKGDTVFFHPLLLHGSGPNLTKGFRKAISCHYADSYSKIIDVGGTTQEPLACEAAKITKRKFKTDIDFQTFWILKSRLVQEDEGNFHLDTNLQLSHLRP